VTDDARHPRAAHSEQPGCYPDTVPLPTHSLSVPGYGGARAGTPVRSTHAGVPGFGTNPSFQDPSLNVNHKPALEGDRKAVVKDGGGFV